MLAYSLTGVPAAVLGAHTLLTIPPVIVEVFLAAFFLAMIPPRHLNRRSLIHLHTRQMAAAGYLIGFLTRLVLSTRPLAKAASVTKASELSDRRDANVASPLA